MKESDSRQRIEDSIQAVAGIEDPELRRLAFGKMLETVSRQRAHWLEQRAKLISVVSVVAGVVISVLTYRGAIDKETRARELEAAARTKEVESTQRQLKADAERKATEAARPFLELRQKYYLEAVHAAAVLANAHDYPPALVRQTRSRFRELYVAELSLVEASGVESAMMKLAAEVDPELGQMTAGQRAAYDLAHALRDSLVQSWKTDQALVDNPSR
jgi:hypothetical protein